MEGDHFRCDGGEAIGKAEFVVARMLSLEGDLPLALLLLFVHQEAAWIVYLHW